MCKDRSVDKWIAVNGAYERTAKSDLEMLILNKRSR